MKEILAPVLALFLIFGCIQNPASTGAGTPDKVYSFSASNNTTGTSYFSFTGVLTKHTVQVNYSGNWSNAYANVTLQGTVDYANWADLASVTGNSTGIAYAIDKPVAAVRIAVSGYNASTNSSISSIQARYAGTT